MRYSLSVRLFARDGRREMCTHCVSPPFHQIITFFSVVIVVADVVVVLLACFPLLWRFKLLPLFLVHICTFFVEPLKFSVDAFYFKAKMSPITLYVKNIHHNQSIYTRKKMKKVFSFRNITMCS